MDRPAVRDADHESSGFYLYKVTSSIDMPGSNIGIYAFGILYLLSTELW